jgi:hypothetical protein
VALAVGVAAVTVGAVVLAGAGGGDEPDAQEALERAATTLDEADSFRFRMTTEDRSVIGEAGGAGSETTQRTVTDVEVAGENWRSRTDSGDWADETVVVDGALYQRYDDGDWELWPDPGPMSDDLEGFDLVEDLRLMVEDSREYDESDAMLEEFLIPTLGGYYLAGIGSPDPLAAGSGIAAGDIPGAFVELFGSFDDAEVVDQAAGRLTLRATRQVPEDIGYPVPPGEFEIVLDGADPVSLRLVVEGETARHASEVRFADWGAGVAIGVPDGPIDETPWVDEDLVAEVLATVTPLAPTTLPDGLALSAVDALSAEDAEEFGPGPPCDQLNLWFAPPVDGETATDDWIDSPDHLSVYLLPASCAIDADPTPFGPGDFGDVPTRETEFGFVEVLVGETVVQFETSYTDDLPAMVASLAPFDIDAVIAAMGEQSSGGFAYGAEEVIRIGP